MQSLSFILFMNFKLLVTNHLKWSNTLKQFVGNVLANCLSLFDHFVGWVLEGLINQKKCLTQVTLQLYELANYRFIIVRSSHPEEFCEKK